VTGPPTDGAGDSTGDSPGEVELAPLHADAAIVIDTSSAISIRGRHWI
jgi:hypothetical protein